MPLQNRVHPNGKLVSESWRGDFMGNRGGRIHDPATRKLLNKRWASRRWICCVTDFKNRQRTVMGIGYTEMFFLDEISALACGHRPCFECRREDAKRFAGHWGSAGDLNDPPTADEMDRVLHAQRTESSTGHAKTEISGFPDGTMFQAGDVYYAKLGDDVLVWTGSGYKKPAGVMPRSFTQLTPEAIVTVLIDGYQPRWHKSAAEV